MNMNSIRWTAAIVGRGKDSKAASVFREHHLEILLVVRGHGTASSAIMDCPELDRPGKDLVLGIATSTDAHQAMEALEHKIELDEPGRGIALSISLSGISIAASSFLKDWGTSQTQITACARENTSMLNNKHYESVATVINTDLPTSVMEATRKADYHGGTLVKTREIGTDEGKKLFGLTLSQEKTIPLILTPVSGKQPILRVTYETISQETGEHTVAFSMSVDEVQGINGQDLTDRPGG